MKNTLHYCPEDFPNFLGSEIEQTDMEEAFFHILPMPYEHSVSYGAGTSLGPEKILQASWQLETWDGKSNPSSLGIHTHSPVASKDSPDNVIKRIQDCAFTILQKNGFIVGLGGEHTVTLGIINAFIQAGLNDFGIVQIDAHADLRDRYEDNPLSHACVMRRISEKGIPIMQLGIRAFCEEENMVRQNNANIHFRDGEELVRNNIQHVPLPESFPDKVFFTLDIDGMDPSVFPSTGTPVPGGLGWYQTLSLFESIAQQREIIGFDITEFAPIEGFHAYEFSAAMLAYKMMGIVQRQRALTSPAST